MVKEYIERDKVLAKAAPVEGCFSNMVSAYDVASIPAADVVEARYGRWYDVNSYEHGERAIATCSHCRVRGAVRTKRTEYGFWVINSHMCPNCGARMDGE